MHAVALSSLDDTIIRVGAVAAALVAIAGLFRMSVRFAVKQITRAVQDEIGVKVEKVYENTMELKPNGGSSMRDAVNRLEAQQMKVVGELAATRQALIDHIADHRTLKPNV